MNVYWVTMSCDHDLVVVAPTPESAREIASTWGLTHGPATDVVEAVLVALDSPRLLGVVDVFA